jgi:hypothetical protein
MNKCDTSGIESAIWVVAFAINWKVALVFLGFNILLALLSAFTNNNI